MSHEEVRWGRDNLESLSGTVSRTVFPTQRSLGGGPTVERVPSLPSISPPVLGPGVVYVVRT